MQLPPAFASLFQAPDTSQQEELDIDLDRFPPKVAEKIAKEKQTIDNKNIKYYQCFIVIFYFHNFAKVIINHIY